MSNLDNQTQLSSQPTGLLVAVSEDPAKNRSKYSMQPLKNQEWIQIHNIYGVLKVALTKIASLKLS